MGKMISAILIMGSFAQWASASRTTHPPAIHIHDWIVTIPGTSPAGPVPAWCNGGGKAYMKGMEMTITNASSVKQTVTVTINPSGVDSASLRNSGQKLRTSWQFNGTGYALGSGAQSKTAVLAPNENALMTAYLNFSGPAAEGDWHMVGTLDVTFVVAEDRGAVSASIETNSENNCANFDNTQVVGMLRNISKVYTVNGGRPF